MSEIDDRFQLSGIVAILVRSKASWEREKIGPIRRIQTPKKKKKPSSTWPAISDICLGTRMVPVLSVVKAQ